MRMPAFDRGATGQTNLGGETSFVAAIPEPTRRLVCTFAIESWRMRRKLDRLPEGEMPDRLTGLSVSLERIESCLKDIDVECREYEDQPYDGGLNVSVLDYEERDDLSPGVELIIQTVSPSVHYQGYLLKRGEVVVGRAKDGRNASNDERHD